MTINIDAPNTTIQLIFSVPEWETLAKAQQRTPTEFRNLVQNWLKGQETSMREELRTVLASKIVKATDAQLDAAKAALGL